MNHLLTNWLTIDEQHCYDGSHGAPQVMPGTRNLSDLVTDFNAAEEQYLDVVFLAWKEVPGGVSMVDGWFIDA